MLRQVVRKELEERKGGEGWRNRDPYPLARSLSHVETVYRPSRFEYRLSGGKLRSKYQETRHDDSNHSVTAQKRLAKKPTISKFFTVYCKARFLLLEKLFVTQRNRTSCRAMSSKY